MDVLSNFLEATGLRGQVFCQTRAAAPWGLHIPPLPQVGLHVVTRGTCWVRLTGEEEVHRLVRGDLILVSRGSGHGLFDDPSSPLQGFEAWKATRDERHRLVREMDGGGEVTHLLCAAFRCDSGPPHPLVRLLPPLIHIPSEDTNAGLERALKSLQAEFQDSDIGGPTIVSRLLDVVFVEILRTWLNKQAEGTAGWLGALRDPGIARVLAHLHGDPAHPWTIEGLAREVGMSRPVLARRFRQKVGAPPAAYLTQLRMDLAARRLRRSEASLAEIAREVGYESEFAFNRAFKKEYGLPPGRFRRSASPSFTRSSGEDSRSTSAEHSQDRPHD